MSIPNLSALPPTRLGGLSAMVRWRPAWGRSRRDDGDGGVLVLMIALVIFGLSLIVVSMDLSKNGALRDAYETKAQNAAQVAVKTVRSNGSLDARSVEKFVTEYLHETGYAHDGSTLRPLSDVTRVGRQLNPYDGSQAAFTRTYDGKQFHTDGTPPGACASVDISPMGSAKDNPSPNPGHATPYMTITLDYYRSDHIPAGQQYGGTAVGKVRFVSEGGAKPTLVDPSDRAKLDPRSGYVFHVLTVDVIEQARNMSTFYEMPPCQRFVIHASATTFGDRKDLGHKLAPRPTP